MKKQIRSIQRSNSPAEVVGYLHNHDCKYEEDASSQPFISTGVFGVEVTNVSDCNSGDEPGERQGNFSEAEEQVQKITGITARMSQEAMAIRVLRSSPLK